MNKKNSLNCQQEALPSRSQKGPHRRRLAVLAFSLFASVACDRSASPSTPPSEAVRVGARPPSLAPSHSDNAPFQTKKKTAKVKPVTPKDPVFQTIENLSDAQALALAPETQAELLDDLMLSGASGIVLALPSQVELSQHPSFPFVWGLQMNALRGWEVSSKLNARLLITELQGEEISVGHLLIPHGKRFSPKPFLSRKGPKPEDQALAQSNANLEKSSFMQVFGVSPAPGRYAVTVFYHDWPSETSVVTVSSSNGVESAAALAAPSLLSEPATQSYTKQAAQRDKNNLPSYEPRAGVGALPTLGLTARLERDPAGRLIALGQLRLTKNEVITANSSLKGKVPDAFVRLHIVVMTLDQAETTIKTLIAPLDEFSGDYVAQFTVDLSSFLQQATSLVYLIAGSQKSGPLEL